MALTHQICLSNHAEAHPVVGIEALALLRYAGKAAADLNLRSWFVSAFPESGDGGSGKLLQDLNTGIYQALADDLNLSRYACFPPSFGENRGPSWTRSQPRLLARQLIGCLSILGLHEILDDLFDFAIADAAIVKGISLPALAARTESPVLSSWAMANADELGRTFGLSFGNDYFAQALAGSASDRNALVPLGIPVLVDQVVRASARTILTNLAAWNEQETIPKPTTFEARKLAELADELDLQDLVAGALDIQGKSDALCAVLGAALRSYHGDGQALAKNLPGPLRKWLAATTRPILLTTAKAEWIARNKHHVQAPAKYPARGKHKQRTPQPKVYVADHWLPRQGHGFRHPHDGERGGLVLGRMPGEQVMVGDDVIVEVLYVKGERVRLRIEAPRSTQVSPKETRFSSEETRT